MINSQSTDYHHWWQVGDLLTPLYLFRSFAILLAKAEELIDAPLSMMIIIYNVYHCINLFNNASLYFDCDYKPHNCVAVSSKCRHSLSPLSILHSRVLVSSHRPGGSWPLISCDLCAQIFCILPHLQYLYLMRVVPHPIQNADWCMSRWIKHPRWPFTQAIQNFLHQICIPFNSTSNLWWIIWHNLGAGNGISADVELNIWICEN